MSTKTELGSSIQQHVGSKNYFGYGSSSTRNVSTVAVMQATLSLIYRIIQKYSLSKVGINHSEP